MAKRTRKHGARSARGTPRSAVGYCRVSTADQAEGGVSMNAQWARIEAYTAAHELELVSIHSDDLSGKRADNRPGLQAAMTDACQHRAPLIVYSLSRLARSTADAIALAEHLERSGADLISVTEQIDTTTAAGRMFFQIMAVLAEFERRVISERTHAALAHKRTRLERTGAIPYGWALADDGRALERHAQEQATLKRMQRWRRAGRTYRDIAGKLNGEGTPAKSGGIWYASTVRSALGTAERYVAGAQQGNPTPPQPVT